MRLNRRRRDAVVRLRGFRADLLAIGLSSKLFMGSNCAGQQRSAQRELLKACRFLAARSAQNPRKV